MNEKKTALAQVSRNECHPLVTCGNKK